MSLASLPEVLIAHIASYLEYEDVCNLMQTSRKNYRAIKAYKKDKLKLDTLRIHWKLPERFSAELDSEDGEVAKSFSFKRFDEDKNLLENVTNVLNECTSVGKILFYGYDLTNDLTKVLYETKAKIGHIDLQNGRINLSGKEFVQLCQKFKGSMFVSHWFWYNLEIWSDEILVPVIKASTGMEVYEIEDGEDDTATNRAELITDRTLKAFGNICPIYFDISVLHNSFTIKEVVNFLKNLKESNCKAVFYSLGFLPSDLLNDAERYFNEDTGELKNEYHIRNAGRYNAGRYNKYYVFVGLDDFLNYNNEQEETPCINFRVMH